MKWQRPKRGSFFERLVNRDWESANPNASSFPKLSRMVICSHCGEQNPDKARFCLECGTKLQATGSSPGEARKTVTIVFSDLVGSTALAERLDSESVREVMDRYFAEIRRVLERHGGMVEKYIGDAVMAVFGLPRAHEDDAHRAVRAAYEMTQALVALNGNFQRSWGVTVANRTGVNTGEVVVGDPTSSQRLATGDVVNVAARLEQAAATNQVLLGDLTYRLVRTVVDVEAVKPLALKGKSDRVPAYRLVEIKEPSDRDLRPLDAPLAGRGDEIRFLHVAFQASVREAACHLVTLEGEAGVGKSRLLKEIEGQLETRATVLRGRCLSYGEGITFWPLAEVVRQAAAIGDNDSLGSAREKLASLLRSGEENLTDRVASLLGLSSTSYPLEDSFRAVALLFQSIAQEGPVVVIFEDIHWAEETFLNLVEQVVEELHEVPCLVVCTARPELRESRPEWGASSDRSSLLQLAPLSAHDSDLLITGLLGEADAAIYSRVAAAAQGNPLYLEQIVSMWMEDGTVRPDNGRWALSGEVPAAIPPSISALLAARLDRLHGEDRATLGAASVIGDVFYQGAVEELSKGQLSEVATRLSGLVRKELIRPDRSTFVAERAFAFRHVLIRNAAYDALLKRSRATLHERFASWLEKVAGERVAEYEEILGYHLEQAHLYLASLGPLGEQGHELGKRAAEYLSNAGRKAMGLGDFEAAVNLLARAGVMLPQAEPARVEVLCDLGEARRIGGGHVDDATAVLREASELAEANGDRRLQTKADLSLIKIDVDHGGSSLEDLQPRAESAVAVLKEFPPSEELAHATALVASIHARRGQLRQAASHFDEAGGVGSRAGSLYAMAESRRHSLFCMWLGPHHVDDILRRGREEAAWARDKGTLRLLGWSLCAMALAEGMKNHVDAAQEFLEQADAIRQRLGLEAILGDVISYPPAEVELLVGLPERAEERLRPLCKVLQDRSLTSYLEGAYALLGESLYAQGRYAESERMAREIQQIATSHDPEDKVRWRKLLAKAMTRSGHDGEPLAREAVRIAEETDMLNLRADALVDLAEVLDLKGSRDQEGDLLEAAGRLYAQKGNVVASRAIRQFSAPP